MSTRTNKAEHALLGQVTRKDFTITVDGSGQLLDTVTVIATGGLISLQRVSINFTSKCNSRNHTTTLAHQDWSVSRKVTDCTQYDEQLQNWTYPAAIDFTVVSSGFDAGEVVEGYLEVEEVAGGFAGIGARGLAGIGSWDSPITSVYLATQAALQFVQAEGLTLAKNAYAEWAALGDGNVVINPVLLQTSRNTIGSFNLPAPIRLAKLTARGDRLDRPLEPTAGNSPFYKWQSRRVSMPVWVEFSFPTLPDVINACLECTRVAVSAAVITAAVTDNPQAGYGNFYPIWKGCMLGKIGDVANQISVTLGTGPQQTGDWY